MKGDLRADLRRRRQASPTIPTLSALAAQAPAGATLVVFHTAVLAYVRDSSDREAFARSVVEAGAVWVANDGSHNIPGAPEPPATHPDPAAFLLCVDAEPVAWTDGHGTWIDWLVPSG